MPFWYYAPRIEPYRLETVLVTLNSLERAVLENLLSSQNGARVVTRCASGKNRCRRADIARGAISRKKIEARRKKVAANFARSRAYSTPEKHSEK